jgi:hypothetical protein
MNARILPVDQDAFVLAPKMVSALNGRIGSDILVPPYQRLVETEYLPPIAPHWTDECGPVELHDESEVAPEVSEVGKILQPRRLLLRVF